MLSDANIPIMEKAAQDPDRKVTFVDLVPGRLYNITLWTVSGGVTSKPLERQDRYEFLKTSMFFICSCRFVFESHKNNIH